GAVADAALLVRLDLSLGDEILLGRARLKITDVIEAEPDRLSDGVAFGPRLMISDAALAATDLVQPGSLVRWTYAVRLPEHTSSERLQALIEQARADFPQAGWRVRSRLDAAPGLQRNISRFAQFLTLVGLTALVVGGVGVANAVRAYLDG